MSVLTFIMNKKQLGLVSNKRQARASHPFQSDAVNNQEVTLFLRGTNL